jgi:hypothetical protein
MKAHDRDAIEQATERGVVVVRYDCKQLRVLFDCSLGGAYVYSSSKNLRSERVELVDAAEVTANLPALGLPLVRDIGVHFDAGDTLDISLTYSGRLRASRASVARRDLQHKSCEGATHFIRTAHVGAFNLRVGSTRTAGGGAEVAGLGGSVRDSHTSRREVSDGDVASCRGRAHDGTAPPEDCGAPLRLELQAVQDNVQRPVAIEANRGFVRVTPCATGEVFSDGKCTALPRGKAYLCRYGDSAECKRECEKGDIESCLNLGSMYMRGHKVPRDGARAVALFERVCTAGEPNGCANLGFALAEGIGGTRDPHRAVGLFQASCDDGSLNGCHNLAEMLLRGVSERPDPKRAFKLFRKACMAGAMESCSASASFHLEGKFVPRNLTLAATLEKRACDGGSTSGCLALGNMYAVGVGVRQDSKAALHYYELACRDGDQKACGYADDVRHGRAPD